MSSPHSAGPPSVSTFSLPPSSPRSLHRQYRRTRRCKWNETTAKAAMLGGQNPIQQTRTVAMVQGAVHDALNAIKPRYAAYYFEGPAAAGATPEVAVAAASHTVLIAVLPSFGAPPQQSEAMALVEEAYRTALADIPDGQAKQDGIAAGRAAGEAMLALRKDDGATRSAPYTPASGPGRWRPHPNPDPPNPPIRDAKLAPGFAASVLPGWGNVTPFTLLSASQYWLAWPAGTVQSGVRTRLQRGEVRRRPGQHGTNARADRDRPVLVRGSVGLVPGRARCIEAEGSICGTAHVHSPRCRWRWPTATSPASRSATFTTSGGRLRRSGGGRRRQRGNRRRPDVEKPSEHPSVSDYPSTQSLFSGAAAAVLAGVFGTDQVAFTITSGPPFSNIQRSFSSFSAAARESADSRVYAGIHFCSACEDGLILGRKIGQRVVASYLQPLKN